MLPLLFRYGAMTRLPVAPALTHPGNTGNSRSPHGTHEYTVPRPDRRAGRFPSGSCPGRCGPQREGLTGCAMYAWAHPREDDWLRLVSAPGRLLLQATAPDGTALACGLFSPWRGQVREFDFTVFRPAFPLAVPLARAAFRWVFRHTETSALWGLCPVSNRHAWRLATACGFVITGRLPAACWLARRGIHVDGIQLLCTPETLARAIKNSPSCHRATQ